MSALLSLQADVIVVGSGPGGATVARELAHQGKKVLLLERGIDYRRPYYGTYLGALIYTDRRSLLFTEEGLNIVRPLMVGGATSMYCGCAAPPPGLAARALRRRYRCEVSETIEELEIAPAARRAARRGLHPHRPGRPGAGLRLAAAAQVHDARPAARQASTAAPSACSAAAAAPSGARPSGWTRRWRPARTCARAPSVERVLIEDGHAAGRGRHAGRASPSPPAPTRSCWRPAASARRASCRPPAFAAGRAGHDHGRHRHGLRLHQRARHRQRAAHDLVVGEPERRLHAQHPDRPLAALPDHHHPQRARGTRSYWPRWNNILGVMIKLKDEVSGGVFPDGKISKPLTARRSRAAWRMAEAGLPARS